MTVYARYDGNNAPSYITPGKLYEVSQEVGRQFNITNDMGRGSLCLWGGCAHLKGGNWTRVDSHPAAAILREIADEAAVNPEFWREFQWKSFESDSWKTVRDEEQMFNVMTYGVKLRRKPKIVKVEGEVSEDAIESARQIINPDFYMVSTRRAETVARALLELVEGE